MNQHSTARSQLLSGSTIKLMLTGAAIGLVIICFLVLPVDEPNPDWGKYWRIRPLILTPLAGAFGILVFNIKNYLKPKSEIVKLLVFFISAIVFLIVLWMGVILGLDGTMWN